MATLAEKRAWLRDNTAEDIPARGRLRPDLESLYDRAHDGTDDASWDIPEAGTGTDDLDWMASAEEEPSLPMDP